MYKLTEKQKKEFEFYKEESNDDKVLFVDNFDEKIGVIEFTFDKETIYNFFEDYPEKLTKSQREQFDKEHPYYKEHFGF
ncbi:MAG: hypothetical protein ACI4A8_08520 [Muribaculaceae bacterium]